MEKAKVDQFLAANSQFFAPESLGSVKSMLQNASDNAMESLNAISFKSPSTMFWIAFLLGGYGVDRFMLGQTGMGVAKLCTCGGCGVWALIDWFSAKKRTYEYNMVLLTNALAAE